MYREKKCGLHSTSLGFKKLQNCGKNLFVHEFSKLSPIVYQQVSNGCKWRGKQYSRKWICLVNCGGLFEINDTVLEFGRAS